MGSRKELWHLCENQSARFDEALFDDQTYPRECPVCMDAFSAESPIRKTPCDHVAGDRACRLIYGSHPSFFRVF